MTLLTPKNSLQKKKKKRSFPLRISLVKDFVTFTEEILNGKLHFLCSDFFLDFLLQPLIEFARYVLMSS